MGSMLVKNRVHEKDAQIFISCKCTNDWFAVVPTMLAPLDRTFPSPPQTAPAAPGALSVSPVRGTLSRPYRGFRGRFITRNGRVLTPADMERAVSRLSQNDLFGVDLKQLLAVYANAPRPQTCIGKPYITREEVCNACSLNLLQQALWAAGHLV